MKIEYSELRYNDTNYNHVPSAVLFSKEKDKKCRSMEAKALINSITNNKKNQGVTFIGDWESQAFQLLYMLKRLKSHKLATVIITNRSLFEFKLVIGIQIYEKVRKTKLSQEYISENLDMLGDIGACMIDNSMNNTYYILTQSGHGIMYKMDKN